ncbi:type I-E CRISPR-associated protein Cas5/CasD [Nocardiopsis baichengensis]|uniref:type I-E CRISPR-associated protein Cas5/CasD n=1 Tax=Nocardiopsis baichengensis TaxID=280240 RepID=UPI00034C1A55|nr:type I-E CRISPR-associated protein Cas5/CasD [Nocardiopsis baichengensis]
MSVLLLQLAGPLQSWGAASRFARRSTENAPTKSGLIGLLAAAQGRERSDDMSDLTALRFGVRIDQPGVRLRDYQTAHHGDTGEAMPVSERFYLADAVFLAAFEGDGALVEELHQALLVPVYLPYLGRRSCPPARPIPLGTAEHSLEAALSGHEWLAGEWYRRKRRSEPEVELGAWLDVRKGRTADHEQRDIPVSFDQAHRRYAMRGVEYTTVTVPNPRAVSRPSGFVHNPMDALGDE